MGVEYKGVIYWAWITSSNSGSSYSSRSSCDRCCWISWCAGSYGCGSCDYIGSTCIATSCCGWSSCNCCRLIESYSNDYKIEIVIY